MASFSQTRGAARRVNDTIRAGSLQTRVHSEQMAQDLRRSQASKSAMANNAYGKAEQLAAQTAAVERDAAYGAARADNQASQKISQLIENLGGSLARNARMVQSAEDAAEVASLKESIREEEQSGFVAGMRGEVKDVASVAYKDAAREGAASMLAVKSLTDLQKRIADLPSGANAQDLVYEYVRDETKDMDTATAEFYSKRVLEGATNMVALKSANDHKAARAEVAATAEAAFLGDYDSGNLQTGEDFVAAVDRTLAVRPDINPGQARAGLFSTLVEHAKVTGTSARALRLLEETGMSTRHPDVNAALAVNAQAELKTAHSTNAKSLANSVELELGQLGNMDLYDPAAGQVLASAAQNLAVGSRSFGPNQESLIAARNKLNSTIEKYTKAKAENDEHQRWVESGGSAEIDPKIRDKYEARSYQGLMSAITTAAANGDTQAITALTQQHKAHIARVGFIPQEIVTGIIGAVNTDLDYRFKGDGPGREQFLVTTEAKMRLIFEADAAAGDGRVLEAAVAGDSAALARLSFLKDTFESGGSIRDSLLELSRKAQPGNVKDAMEALEGGGFKAHLKAVGSILGDMSPATIVEEALVVPGMFNDLDVNIADNPAFANRIVGAYKNYMALFGGPGVDPSTLHEKAMAHVKKFAQGSVVNLPTADGDMDVPLPSRAVRDVYKTPAGGMSPKENIRTNLDNALETLKVFYGDLGEDDLPPILEGGDLNLDPNSMGPDGSMRLVAENGVTPILIDGNGIDAFATDGLDGDVSTGAQNFSDLLKPFNMSIRDNGYNQYEVFYKYDPANIDAQASEKLMESLKGLEENYITNGGPRRPFPTRLLGPDPSTWNGQNLLDDLNGSSEVIGSQGNDTLEAPKVASFSDVLNVVSGEWKQAGTLANKRTVSANAGLNTLMNSVTHGARREGLVAASLGGTRPVPQVNSIEEGLDMINREMDAQQVERHAGVPIDPKSGRVEDSYAYRRREALIESEGNKGTQVYRDHKGIATVGIGINLQAGHNARFVEENFGGSIDEYIDGTRKFSQDQVDILFDYNMAKAEEVVNTKLGKVKLTSNQRVALVSLAFNLPSLIGPNLIGFIKAGKWEDAESEIRRRSNAQKHRGLQNRRNREADLFALDTHDPEEPFYFT